MELKICNGMLDACNNEYEMHTIMYILLLTLLDMDHSKRTCCRYSVHLGGGRGQVGQEEPQEQY